MRRYGAFQSEVNSFPTINCIPPPTYHPYPTLFTLASLSLCLFAVDPLALSQPSSSFSLVLHIHIVLLASRRTRHVPATYIVPPNNVCPKGREITDLDGRRISRVSSADRASRKSVRGKKRATSTTDIYEGQLARLFLSPRLWLLPVCRVINGTRNLEKATPLRQPIVSRREGATGVIGHNLVDSLIYKQSLMKFLVFINNALQPRAPVCRHRYPGIPRCFSLSLPLFTPFIPFHFPAHTPVPPLPRVPSSDTLYRPGFQPTLTPRRSVLDEPSREYVFALAIRFSVDRTNQYNSSACLKRKRFN